MSRCTFRSLPESLRVELSAIRDDVHALVDESTIHPHRRDSHGGLFFITAYPQDWGPSSDAALRLQTRLRARVPRWSERIRFLSAHVPHGNNESAERAIASLVGFYDREGNHCEPSSPQNAHEIADAAVETLLATLGQVVRTGDAGMIVVPDSNAIALCPAFERLAAVLGTDDFEVVLTAPLLREMEDLKVKYRNDGFREKVERAIRYVKELHSRARRQGVAFHEGVKVAGRVHARSLPGEPNVAEIASWLDADLVDDRLIACALDEQRRHPAACVVVLTCDVNMQTKCDFAGLPFAEPPRDDATEVSQ